MNCSDADVRNCKDDEGVDRTREIQLGECSGEKVSELSEYWGPRIGIPDELFQSYSSCINDDSAFLRSESTSPLFS